MKFHRSVKLIRCVNSVVSDCPTDIIIVEVLEKIKEHAHEDGELRKSIKYEGEGMKQIASHGQMKADIIFLLLFTHQNATSANKKKLFTTKCFRSSIMPP